MKNKLKLLSLILEEYYNLPDSYLYNNIKKRIINEIIISRINSKEDILQFIWNEAMKEIASYDRESIYSLAEYFRERYCMKIHGVEHEFQMAEINEIGLYLRILYIDNTIIWGEKKLSREIFRVLEILRIYNIVNINSYLAKGILNNHEIEALFEPNSEVKINEYLDNSYLEQYEYIRIENSTISDDETLLFLSKERLLPSLIKEDLFNEISAITGFKYKDVDSLFHAIILIKDQWPHNSHIHIDEDTLFSLLSPLFDCQESFKRVIDFITLNKYCSDVPNTRKMELLCINKNDKMLSFSCNCVLETLTIISNIIVSGHFNDHFHIKVPEKITSRYQNKLSTYFSYYMADVLYHRGMDIPRYDSGVFDVEIMDIENEHKKIVFDDLDVIGCDHKNKIFYILELKYYKAALDLRKLVTMNLRKKLYDNIMDRHNKVASSDSISIIGFKKFKKDISGYTVKSVLVTSRPTMISHNLNLYSEEIKCLSLSDLLKISSVEELSNIVERG